MLMWLGCNRFFFFFVTLGNIYAHYITVIAAAISPSFTFLLRLLFNVLSHCSQCVCANLSPHHSVNLSVCLAQTATERSRGLQYVGGGVIHYQRQWKACDHPQTTGSAEKKAVPVLINIHIWLNNRKTFSLSSPVHRPGFSAQPETWSHGWKGARRDKRKKNWAQERECKAKWRPLACRNVRRREEDQSDQPWGWSPRKRQVMPLPPPNLTPRALTSC